MISQHLHSYSPRGRGKQDWQTPPALFVQLDREFSFTVDAAASEDNHLCPRYWTAETDGLSQDWSGERVFCNPPFGQASKWTKKAAESIDAESIVFPVPASIDTRWWAQQVLPTATEVRFIKSRVRFYKGGEPGANLLPSACCIIVWGPGPTTNEPIVSWGLTWAGAHSPSSWAYREDQDQSIVAR